MANPSKRIIMRNKFFKWFFLRILTKIDGISLYNPQFFSTFA